MIRFLSRRAFLAAFTIAAPGAGAVFFMSSLTARAVEGVEFSTVKSGGKAFTVCRADLARVKLQLFHRDGTGQPLNRFDRLEAWLRPQGRRLVFAMNAGMFHPGFEAVGLFVSDGKTLSPFNATDGKGNFFLKPNGVFAITDKGARVVETSEFSKLPGPVLLATQSGPLLVRGGKFHPAFNAGSVSRLIRNGVGVMSPEKVVFAISDEPVNFHEFATLFRDTLKCPDALFLDGTISSLFAPAIRRRDSSHDLGPMIGITAP